MAGKYNASRICVGDQKFDSKAEYRRWIQLKSLLAAGKITDLRRQVVFELIPTQRIGGHVVERSVNYVADFVYLLPNGQMIVEDTKSPATKTPEYIIKRKLMLWVHGISVREVMSK